MIFGFKKTEQARKIEFLRSIPIFCNLNKSEFIKLDMIIHERQYKEEEIIFYENEPGASLYIIKSGKVELIKKIEGEEKRISILKEGEFFGEIGVLIASPRITSARAMEKTELLSLPRPDLLNLIERNPKVGSRILLEISKVIAERLSKTMVNQ